MSASHPTAEQMDRYRRGTAAPEELLSVDEHVAECDRCHAAVDPGRAEEIVITLPPDPGDEETDHLTYDEMEQWVDGLLSDVDRELVEGHIDGCDRCRLELTDLHRASKALPAVSAVALRQTSGRRWMLPAAAILALAIGGVWFVLRNEAPVAPTAQPRAAVEAPPQSALPVALQARLDEVRRTGNLTRPGILTFLSRATVPLRGSESAGTVFTLVEPIGTVIRESRPQFAWTPVPGASAYSVAVADADSGEVVASGSTEKPLWRSDAPLEQGRTYSWQVTAHRGDQSITAPRPPAPEALFRVASRSQIEELNTLQRQLRNDHLTLGILFAEEGILDDAERELKLAARDDLLAQVRSWRK
jgi:hypothetical protein